MKKILVGIFVVILAVLIFFLNFNYKAYNQPSSYYEVYLDDEYIGLISNKKELEDYINNQANEIKENIKLYKLRLDAIEVYNENKSYAGDLETPEEVVNYLVSNQDKYNLTKSDIDELKLYVSDKLYVLSSSDIKEINDYIEENSIYEVVDEVYTPNGIEIKKVYTFDTNILTTEEVYLEIISRKSCTVAGYKFTIKANEEDEGSKDIDIYVLDNKMFTEAVENMIKIFVDESKYEAYKNNTQSPISVTGVIIENVYIDNDIIYKAVNIPIEEKIYTNINDLSKYLLYGNVYDEKNVKIKSGDSIESVAYDNKISVQEFLISNPQYTSRDNLLAIGTNVKISKIDPKIQIVEETYEVVDKPIEYKVVEVYDENLNQGTIFVTQKGENGLERITQNIKYVNGEISYIDPVAKETIKSSVPKIITIGSKYVPDVGSLTSWGWPTNSNYRISSYFGYRTAIFTSENFHGGLDIAGTGYGSPVYATNNGTIQELRVLRDSKGNYTSYGIYIMINHNNGYWSLYGHLSGWAEGLAEGATVTRGQVIGYVGSTGFSTGPHLHFEIRNCPRYSCHLNPLPFLLK